MSVAIVTGSAGLVGSEAARFFSSIGMDVVGIDNDMRREFFGPDASTHWNLEGLQRDLPSYLHESFDIRDESAVSALFRRLGKSVALVVHAAAQPSHDWAARNPFVDFHVNASGTLNVLEAVRQNCPDAAFIFTSTNKVYGDRPNDLPLVEEETRYEIDRSHRFRDGIDETMGIDQSRHSLFGASKVAADVLVQEYGRYFGMNTVCFRGGCLTGPGHSGTELHGFLAYLMKCVAIGNPYTIFGYKGKQVRDNIHSADLIAAFNAYFRNPRPAAVYNIGGGRTSNCSMLEAIALCQEVAGRELKYRYTDENRSGDHIWYISDLRRFKDHYPEWDVTIDVAGILKQIFELNAGRWAA